jgi:predicted outer membrane repeat protein
MKYGKIIIILMLAVFLVSMSGVCAGEVNDTIIANEDTAQIESAQSDEVCATDDSQAFKESNDGEIAGNGSVGTFSDLSRKVKQPYVTVTLDMDYECEDGFNREGIEINYPVTIDGQGHTIDAKGKARIFQFSLYENDTEVVLKNITFINGKCDDRGGAIQWINAKGSIVNCTFINNSVDRSGGAIFGEVYGNLSISDCVFINNQAKNNGAICNYGFAINAERCIFKTKTDTISGVKMAMHGLAFYSREYYSGEKITFDCAADDAVLEFHRDGKVFCTYHCSGQYAIVLPYFGEFDYDIDYAYDVFYISNGSRIYAGAIVINRFADYSTQLVLSTEAVYDSDDYVTVTLKDNLGHPVSGWKLTVDFNGVKTVSTDRNGQIKLPTEGLAAGTYRLYVTFNRSHAYTNSECCAEVTVKKATPIITASEVSTVYNQNKDLIVTLKDSKNQALAGFNVTILLNGRNRTLTTDSSGRVKLSTDGLAPDSYVAQIAFAGNENYTSSAKSVKVEVKKAAPILTAKAQTFKVKVKTKKYSVTLKDNNGKAIGNAKVTLKIKGKKAITVKTDGKGKATFKITNLKKKGKYTASITFNGDKYYGKATKNVKFTVKK